MIHAIGFVHTTFTEAAFSHCAYTTKVVRWVEMMAAQGEDITVYWGGDEPEWLAGTARFVSLMPPSEQLRYFGDDLPASILALDWNPVTPHWQALNHRAAATLHGRLEEGDMVAVLSGSNHDVLMTEFPGIRFLEPWVGYAGISGHSYAKVYESWAWRHHMAGQHRIADGQPLDAVIPNFYRPDDFETGTDEGYLLFVGRMIKRKGIEDALAIAQRAGRPLIMAGQGATTTDGKVVCNDGTVLDPDGADVRYIGVVGPQQRRSLYAHASATLVPTLYWEPFGGVFAEAMFSGVQPVCRDWGCFVEYVGEEFRFSAVDQALEALDRAVAHRGMQVRDAAVSRFSMDVVAKQFSEWLGRVRAS